MLIILYTYFIFDIINWWQCENNHIPTYMYNVEYVFRWSIFVCLQIVISLKIIIFSPKTMVVRSFFNSYSHLRWLVVNNETYLKCIIIMFHGCGRWSVALVYMYKVRWKRFRWVSTLDNRVTSGNHLIKKKKINNVTTAFWFPTVFQCIRN